MPLTVQTADKPNPLTQFLSHNQKFTMIGASLTAASVVASISAIYLAAGIGLLYFTGALVSLEGSTITITIKSMDLFKQHIKNTVRQNGLDLQHIPDWLKADRDIVLAAVKQNGLALEFASDFLKADRDIVLAAVQQNGQALQFAPKHLKADRDIVLKAVRKNGLALQYVDASLSGDRDIVLEAIRQNGWAHKFISGHLMNNEKIAIAAQEQIRRKVEIDNAENFKNTDWQTDEELAIVDAALHTKPNVPASGFSNPIQYDPLISSNQRCPQPITHQENNLLDDL